MLWSEPNMKPTDRGACANRGQASLGRLAMQVSTAIFLMVAVSACQMRPLYATGSDSGATLPKGPISVTSATSRVSQQVRNHLLFLVQGGASTDAPAYNVELRVTPSTLQLASNVNTRDASTSAVTVTGSYVLTDVETKARLGGGTLSARASFDRTTQSFANLRAERDAQNRAARELAEQLRLAIIADVSN